jgi:hypothetical protein
MTCSLTMGFTDAKGNVSSTKDLKAAAGSTYDYLAPSSDMNQEVGVPSAMGISHAEFTLVGLDDNRYQVQVKRTLKRLPP